jgi:DNA-binding MarR family transcriptional regulator
VTHPLVYDPVDASRQRWIQQGWADTAAGMAAVVSVMRAEQIFLRRASHTLRPLGLTFARYQVLGMLRWTGPMTLGAVGHHLWITPGTVTSSVDRLEAVGLCRRLSHPTDARATLVEITAKGRRLFDRAVERLNAELFGTVGLDDEELDLLVRLIGKLRAADGDVVTAEGGEPTNERPAGPGASE